MEPARGEGASEGGVGVLETEGPSLQDLLAGYDSEVRASLGEAFAAGTGTERVRALHNSLGPALAVLDAVLESTLCPLIEDLPGGKPVADRILEGCRERAELLRRFEALSKGVAAHNVYPVSGAEIERILEGLERSFDAHTHEETTQVDDVLTKAAASTDPEVVAARLAIAIRSAPTRVHVPTLRHPRSGFLSMLYRDRDRVADWVDTHHGWVDPRTVNGSVRAQQVEELQGEAEAPSTVTVRDLLAGYDATVDAIIEQMRAASSDLDRAETAHRLNAAITIHDSVLCGVLCRFLESIPGGDGPAARLREGCLQRAETQQEWNALTRRVAMQDLYALHRAQADKIVRSLIEDFEEHEKEESLEVSELLEKLPPEAYRRISSPFSDVMWSWHSEGPGLLALRMAVWARRSPTRVHPLMVKHPRSRTLRSFYHFTDYFRDYWPDTALAKWLFPAPSSRPFSEKKVNGPAAR